MKFAANTVLEVSIFDDKGGLVTHLDTTKNSKLLIEEGKAYLLVTDALLDDKLLAFIGRKEKSNLSDFEKHLHKQKYSTTIIFSKSLERDCKIIGKGILRSHNMEDREFLFEAPNATTGNEFEFKNDEINISEFDYLFTIYPYNVDGDLLKMHIE